VPAISARIHDPSQIAEARRNARQLAADLKFSDHAAEKVAIVVTEACTNLIKHASGGQIIIDQAAESSPVGEAREPAMIEILALDKGPGIENLSQSREDGYSTSGTSGTGLGAISRLSDYWGIYTRPGRGTALLARISQSNEYRHDGVRSGAIRVPKPGQDVCGDDWGMTIRSGHRMLLLADGLGHGPDAARASAAAVQTLYRHDAAPGAMIEAVHAALRHTRGAAVAVAEIDAEHSLVRFSGLGNISASILADGESVRHLVSLNGTAGMEARLVREFTYPWPEGGILVLHSDGIGSHWSLSDYPALGECDPTLIAGVIYRDLSRGNDDATIVVAR